MASTTSDRIVKADPARMSPVCFKLYWFLLIQSDEYDFDLYYFWPESRKPGYPALG